MRSKFSALAFFLFVGLLSPSAARAQGVVWDGWYVGADFSDSFKSLDFSMNLDTAPGHTGSTYSGHASPRFNFGGHVGRSFRVSQVFVVGGEFGVGKLGYFGTVSGGAGNDTAGETKGGVYWTGAGRVGFVHRQVMPYVTVGAIGASNTATIVDSCTAFPCSSSTSAGSGTAFSIRWMYSVGMEIGVRPRIAGLPWALRFEWMQAQNEPVINTFTPTLTPGGGGVPQPWAYPAEVSTQQPTGAFRIQFDLKLGKR